MITYNQFMKKVEFQDSWNKKRIFIVSIIIVILMGIAIELKGNIIPNLLKNKRPLPAIREQAIYRDQGRKLNLNPNLDSVISQKLESIKQDAEKINISEIATSSSQIQKIINDIKNLQNLPNTQLKEICFNICKGL